ncbi:MAG: hypothetical protein ACJ71Q_08005 [Terriglobales bacterium]|jgi:hypothetical protein
MEVCSPPGSLSYFKLELLEAAFQSFPLSPLARATCVFRSDLLEILSDHAGERSIPLYSDFPQLFDESSIEAEGYIHIAHIKGNP